MWAPDGALPSPPPARPHDELDRAEDEHAEEDHRGGDRSRRPGFEVAAGLGSLRARAHRTGARHT